MVCSLFLGWFIHAMCSSFQEVEQLRMEKLHIDQELRTLSVNQPGPYFPPPRERRYVYRLLIRHIKLAN